MAAETAPFPSHRKVAPLRDGDLSLEVETLQRAQDSPWGAPGYRFALRDGGVRAGGLGLRLGWEKVLTHYAGHVGYGVRPRFRGRGLAGRAVRLVLPLAHLHGLDPLWITCSPDNLASRRVLERLGADYIETVELPPSYARLTNNETRKMRFRLPLS